ncbi:hypothetical protein BU14_0235s0006 [Porphyra umbilicalis]|uniref:glutathione-specific gamma-glutamylcyclotransferase n=1 Tax=Porphyra umbilicalis TaxID=2786 RepID=A0A1X6P3P3_PORUM|nr:hypothetical protein BU14_0235s0006 [Porphyra umbilicalis]|eukprot:OSX75457.1 hypothetical protein BU14_0235s0006 [Porphyra umbilicalis]
MPPRPPPDATRTPLPPVAGGGSPPPTLPPVTPPVWLFGYGSLIWRPAIPHTATLDGYITPYRRAFYQASTDHRGTPDAPGRVVTLLSPPEGAPPVAAEDPSWRVYGRAFRLPDADAQAIMADVDVREQGGYTRTLVTVHAAAGGDDGGGDGGGGGGGGKGRLEGAICYVGDAANPMFRGGTPAERDDAAIAAIIDTAVGPSGPNDVYLVRLHEALASMGGDPHVAALVAHLRRRRAARGGTGGGRRWGGRGRVRLG